MEVKWLLVTPSNLNFTRGRSCCSALPGGVDSRLSGSKAILQPTYMVSSTVDLPNPYVLPTVNEVALCCYCWFFFFPLIYSADIRGTWCVCGKLGGKIYSMDQRGEVFSDLTPPPPLLCMVLHLVWNHLPPTPQFPCISLNSVGAHKDCIIKRQYCPWQREVIVGRKISSCWVQRKGGLKRKGKYIWLIVPNLVVLGLSAIDLTGVLQTSKERANWDSRRGVGPLIT